MTEWLYVLEINPGSRIKAGRTASLGNRLVTHTASAGFAGGALTRVFTIACRDSKSAEQELLIALAHQPGVQRAFGREMFTGVSFSRGVELAERIAASRQPSAPNASPLPTGLLNDCREAFGADARVHLAELHRRLIEAHPDTYGHLTLLTLSSALRDVGIRTSQMWLSGRNAKGVRSSDFDRVAAETA